MKNIKKMVAMVAAAGVLSTAGVAFAATLTPGEIAAGLTGKTVEALAQERAAGKTYGTIANEAGKLAEFKSQMLQQKKAVLDQRVQEGTLTQEKADEIIGAIEQNQATCDGTGTAQIGKNSGAAFGRSAGKGQGAGMGAGMGTGAGMGAGAKMGTNRGAGLADGSGTGRGARMGSGLNR